MVLAKGLSQTSVYVCALEICSVLSASVGPAVILFITTVVLFGLKGCLSVCVLNWVFSFLKLIMEKMEPFILFYLYVCVFKLQFYEYNLFSWTCQQ